MDRDNDGYACETFFGYIGDPVVSKPDVPSNDDGTEDSVADEGTDDSVNDLPSTGVGTVAADASQGPTVALSVFMALMLSAAAVLTHRRQRA